MNVSRLNELQLDQKRIRFRELELMEQGKIEQIEKITNEINAARRKIRGSEKRTCFFD